jgi:IstB-like ATP binding protein
VLGIAVAQLVLHSPQIDALVGEVVTAGVPQHVRPDAAELRGLPSDPHDIVDGLAGELGLALGHEQPWQIAIAYVTKDQAETSVLFELIAARYERRSMLITANQPFGEWGKIFPDRP